MNYILTIWKIFDDEFLIGNGLRLICAALDYDPEKIGKHMLEMLAKFRNEGIIELNLQDNSKKIRADGIDRRLYV
ncbi:MAG: hypothetical protein IKM73_03850 [Acidaminococcaceae bacterium]|nr:hypothetical protein [Acidaminococcaceae bacterium]